MHHGATEICDRRSLQEEMPDNFVMAQFLSIRLRALALAVGRPIVCSDWWGPMAEEVLAQEGLSYEKWQKFGKRESKHPHHGTESRVAACKSGNVAGAAATGAATAEDDEWMLLRETCRIMAPRIQKRPHALVGV